ncbi:response regulator [Massilia sp. PWRC2]|uniref:response regulator n=1 Tax=Massilia sp. PWRC2 TaxID=2804626 RepID=UPI003CEB926C
MLKPEYFTEKRADLAGWVLSLIVFAIVGASLTTWYAVESKRLQAAETERLAALSNILVKDITVNLVAVDRALGGVVRDRLVRGGSADQGQLKLRLHALVDAMPGLAAIVVTNANGVVTAAMPPALAGRDFSQRPYFVGPRQGGDAILLYLSPPFRSLRGDTVMNATRVIARGSDFDGVISAVLDPGYFSAILQVALYAPDMRATIAHGSGAAFVSAGASSGADTAADRAALLGADAIIAPPGLRSDSVLTLHLRRQAQVVLAPLRRQAQVFGAACAALALLWCGGLLWYQARRRLLMQSVVERRRERRLADALSISEARFRTLIEEAPVAVAMARHGRFIYTNRRYNLLHGYAADEDLTGMTWRAMIAPASQQQLAEQLACLDADAAIEQRFEALGVGNGGASIPVFKATARVMLSDGPASLIFVQDISAQKSAEGHLLEARDAAEAANRSKAEFLANMSHEIRTPLNAILGMAYLLEQGNRDRASGAMLQKIRVAGRSLLGIINDILDVSKIEAGAMPIERSWFALQDVIDVVAATMGVAVADKPIALRIVPLPALAAHVLGDALRFEQLLVNLTSNAIKFTERGSVSLEVTATVLADGQAELVFRVSDTGIGIASTEQQNIFSSFTQADTSTTRRYGGSGLGLTICKRIVDLMGGRIGVDSVAGSGSTFTIALTVPVRASAVGALADMLALEVLIAEADTASASLPATALALGWRVRQAGSGSAVLDILHRSAGALPAAIVLDCQLPGSGWRATARAIRAAAGFAACPVVVVVSTHQAAAFEADSERALADAVLTTPVTSSTLYNAVLEARHKRSSRAVAPVKPARAGNALHGLRLLVVDDSEINRDVAQRILEGEGACVVLAEHGRAAIDYLLAHGSSIDLVLMDVQMPVMDGIEATTRLRAMPQFAELPIVALTAGAFSAHQDAARNAGMSHFIAKPFDVAATIALIGRLTAVHDGRQVTATGAIDEALGAHTWGSQSIFQSYLPQFVAAFADAVPAMRATIAAGDLSAAAAAAHKLAGAAASVALPAVTALALRLERELAAGDAGAATLELLASAMRPALAAIARLAPSPCALPLPATALASAPTAAIETLLQGVLNALEASTPAPPALALAALAPHLAPALLAPIRLRVEQFDWPGAASQTCALAATLGLALQAAR